MFRYQNPSQALAPTHVTVSLACTNITNDKGQQPPFRYFVWLVRRLGTWARLS